MRKPEVCARCGHEAHHASGKHSASVGGLPYCHESDHSCYVLQVQEDIGDCLERKFLNVRFVDVGLS